MVEGYPERFILNEESVERIANINGASNRLKNLSSEYHLPGFLGFTGFGKLFTRGDCEVEVIGELEFRKPIMYAFCEVNVNNELLSLDEIQTRISDVFDVGGGELEEVSPILISDEIIKRSLNEVGAQVDENVYIAIQAGEEYVEKLNIPKEISGLFHLQIGDGLNKYRKQVLEHLDMLQSNGDKIWNHIVGHLQAIEQEDEIMPQMPYYPATVRDAIQYYLIDGKA